MKQTSKFQVREYYDNTKKDTTTVLDNIEITIKVNQQDLLYKDEYGNCEVTFENERRKGVIISLSSKGTYIIGLLKTI